MEIEYQQLGNIALTPEGENKLNFFLLSSCVQFQSALSGRRKLEVDLQTLLQEHEELQAELRGSTDKAKKASCEVVQTGFQTLVVRCSV